MAATVHLTGQPRSWAVVPLGPFGARVAELLAADRPGCTVVPAGAVEAAFALEADLVIAALWRPSPALCERADTLSFSLGRRWLPLTMDQRRIHVGPLVVPPQGPCHGCQSRRLAQHDRHYQETQALNAAFDQDAACGPGGYLPHHARLAAAMVRHLADGGRSPDPAGSCREAECGSVVTINLTDCAITADQVITCHDCTRCRPDSARSPGTGIITQILAQAAAANTGAT